MMDQDFSFNSMFRNLNLSQGTDGQEIISFSRTNTNISLVGPEIDSFFDPQKFSYPQPCAYAISGQYGFLPRLLYYLLLIISMFLRKHDWLSAGALAGAMTYSASACVHAFALLLHYDYNTDVESSKEIRESRSPRYFGDTDLAGIFPILVAGCIMLTPILNWSTMIRKHHAQPVVLYWGILMFFALIFTLSPSAEGVQPYIIRKLATCFKDESLGCTYEGVMGGDGFSIISLDFYNKCQCHDTCGAVSLSDAPFRRNTNLQAFLLKRKVYDFLLNSSFNYLRSFSFVFLLFIIWQGILGMIAIKWGQRESRNWIFRRLGGSTPYSSRLSFLSKTRYYAGKFTAGAFYSFALFVTFVSPFLFVLSVIINEIVVWAYPVTETYDAIGQWSIWVVAGFITSAAIIQRYHSTWVRFVIRSYSAFMCYIKRIYDERTFVTVSLEQNCNQRKTPLRYIRALMLQFGRPFKHIRSSTAGFWNRVLDEWRDFKRWRADPVAVSNRPPDKSSDYNLHDGLLQRESEETGTAPYQREEAYASFGVKESSTWRTYDSLEDSGPKTRVSA